jgi:D-sedoheptulose 7-phosphate isomerase
MSSHFIESLQEHIELMNRLAELDAPVTRAGTMCATTLREGGKLMLCGNGGSASDSQHIAAELVGRFQGERRALAAIALSTDTSALTAIANDYGYADVFARQVEGLGRAGDCLIAISTSGGSPNVLRAVQRAHAIGIKTIGLAGKDGGALREACDIVIVVPSSVTARIQEAHILIGHTLCGLIERELALVAGP